VQFCCLAHWDSISGFALFNLFNLEKKIQPEEGQKGFRNAANQLKNLFKV
jgi:hypothetical protein